jgi:hypothetical protein
MIAKQLSILVAIAFKGQKDSIFASSIIIVAVAIAIAIVIINQKSKTHFFLPFEVLDWHYKIIVMHYYLARC